MFGNMNMDSKNGGKYALRTKSIIKRIESEKNRSTSKRKEPKEKQKPPPLSKYRRKTANARERNRMKEINDAFITLQQSIPDLPGADADKLTKITVLRLAVNYIDALAGVLNADDTVSTTTTDIEDVRELWCLQNAHMAQPEHCVRPVIRTNKVPSVSPSKSKCSAIAKTSPGTGGNSNCNNSKVSKLKCPSVGKTNDNRSKNGLVSKTITKRPSKSKSKTKVCKTASIATSNGAYITLKNVALQTPAHKLGKHANNEPLMMSMTVKRPRQDHYLMPRDTKMARIEPMMTLTSVTQPQLALTPCRTDLCHVPTSIPGLDFPEPLVGATPFTPRPYASPASLTSLTIYNPTDTTPLNVMEDLDSPVVRNDVLLEFPRSGRHFSDSSSADSAFSSEGSAPPSPLTCFTSITPLPVPIGDSSPAFSVTSSDFSVCGSTSDCDSVLTSPMELGSLLGDDPFEGLDHLTSTFAEGDDTLNLFLAHSTSNFMCAEIDDC